MRILITNDDGINAKGIEKLAQMAVKLGEVWVVAPAEQCSAMSSRISLRKPMMYEEYDFPVKGVKAYSLAGTPADCVKVALAYLMPEKPDFVFSGINFGFNTGFDIIYSGTIGAAMEGLLHGIPSIAFSNAANDDYEVIDKHLLEITRRLIGEKIAYNEIFNVNFPGCRESELRGVKENVAISTVQIYQDHYYEEVDENGNRTLEERGDLNDRDSMIPGTDVYAVFNNYIAIGKVKCSVL